MKTLAITNQKGGVGKTALVVNFALYFVERGLKTAVVDLDIQGNSSFTLSAHAAKTKASDFFLTALPSLPDAPEGTDEGGRLTLFPGDTKLVKAEESGDSAAAVMNLRKGLSALATAGYDVCLLDSPAAPGVRFMAGLLAADYILAPIELEAYSIQGIGSLVTTIANARKMNPKAQFLGMLANKVDKRTPRHTLHLAQLQEAYPQLLLPTTIGLRGSIAESLVSGAPVWKNKKTAARQAAKEIRQAAEYVYAKMGLGKRTK